MQYINKSTNRDEGNEITKNYLQQIWIEDEQRYPVDYDGSFRNLPTKANSYYKQMTRVLLNNQNHYCCYCMRRLTGNIDPATGDPDTTLEHIIPQAANDQQACEYQRDEFPELKNNIKLSRQFSHEENPNLSKLPHTVCYDNLVASCHGSFPITKRNADKVSGGHSCNHPRGTERALPLYLLSDVDTIIYYGTNGSIVANPDSQWYEEANELINNAKLTWNTLTEIRYLWYVLKDIDIEEILEEGRDEQSREDLFKDNLWLYSLDENENKKIANKFKRNEYWDSFLLYSWFHSYKWNAE